MAGPWYYRSLATGTGDGLSWTNARVTLATQTSVVAGDTIYVADDHAETTAGALGITFPGTIANPNFVYCANHLVPVPGASDLTTGATVTTTGANAITIAGSFYCRGISFLSGTGATAANMTIANTANSAVEYELCNFTLGTTTGAGMIQAGTTPKIVLNNTTVTFNATGQAIRAAGFFIWKYTANALGGATFPGTLFNITTEGSAAVILQGVDLSALGTGTIVGTVASSIAHHYAFGCKTAAATVLGVTPGQPAIRSYFSRVGSAGVNYAYSMFDYYGKDQQESAITRQGGTTQPDGTQISKKLTTTANSKWVSPFDALPMSIWNTKTTSTVVTVYGVINAGLPNNDDIWIEVEYLGSNSSPLSSLATSTKANNLATGVPLTVDTSVWNTLPVPPTGWATFSISVTVTPGQAGPMNITVRAAKTSSVFYIDPTPVLV